MYTLTEYSTHNTLRHNTKFPSDKKSSTKNAMFFLSQAPTYHKFTFNL